MRQIIVANSSGFCWGVKRAFDKVLKTIESAPKNHKIFTYGPLIHNSQAVDMLASKGVKVLDSISDKIDGTVIIRTHGVEPGVWDKLEKSGAIVSNATCPDVARIQSLVKKHKKLGYGIVIIGNEEHPEVSALLGFAGDEGMCVVSKNDIHNIPNWEKICIVSQSTQSKKRFWDLVEKIKEKHSDALVFDTICKSTEKRQDEAMELSKKVDVMIVVGGKNSANTKRLVEICGSNNTPTFHIENREELNEEMLASFKAIGITAGASTPAWVIEDVISFIKGLPDNDA